MCVGIMIHMLYLMATHLSQMINYSAEKFTHFHEDKSFFHVEKNQAGSPGFGIQGKISVHMCFMGYALALFIFFV